MSKHRNRNRSAKRATERMSRNAMREDSREYVKYIRTVSKTLNWSAGMRELLDYDDVRANRRIDAAVALFEDYQRTAHELGFEMSDALMHSWLHLGVGVKEGMDMLERDYQITLAAAICILDCLAGNGRIDEACRLFPDESVYGSEEIPFVRDLSHPEQMIRGMVWIIRHRNDDCIGMKCRAASGNHRAMADDYTAAGKHHQTVQSRDRFERILAMLPTEKIKEVLSEYRDAYHDVLGRMLRSYRIYYAKQDAVFAERRNFEKSALDVLRNDYDAGEEAKQLLSAAIRGDVEHNRIPGAPYHTYERQLVSQALCEWEKKLEADMSVTSENNNRLNVHISDYFTMSCGERQRMFGSEVSRIWEDFQIRMPYNLCLAYLYMLDQDYDAPWIYGISSNLMGFCGRALPWLVPYEEANLDDRQQFGPVSTTEPTQCAMYMTYFEDRLADEDSKAGRCNIPQILYRRTGYILPRVGCNWEENQYWLERFGLRDTSFQPQYHNMVGLLLAHAHRSEMPAPAQAETAETVDPEVLMRRIRELEEAQKALRQEAYEAGREARSLKEKLEAVEAERDAERQELFELRELLFTDEEAEPEEDAECPMNFPRDTGKKIVVFGGHCNWYHIMKTMLPDVRFFRHEANPSARMIQTADEIWFQTRNLSHKLYVAVRNHAAGHPVRIRYFHNKGAANCARELIEAQSA